jgi:hypothetical protein
MIKFYKILLLSNVHPLKFFHITCQMFQIHTCPTTIDPRFFNLSLCEWIVNFFSSQNDFDLLNIENPLMINKQQKRSLNIFYKKFYRMLPLIVMTNNRVERPPRKILHHNEARKKMKNNWAIKCFLLKLWKSSSIFFRRRSWLEQFD